MLDMTDRIEFDDKAITVLDDLQDVESVMKRYRVKGWSCVHASRPEPKAGEPAVVVLHMQRPKKS